MAARRNPEKPKSPSVSDLPVAAHTHVKPQGSDCGSAGARSDQVSSHVSLRAKATGKDPWQLCLLGKMGM